MAKSRLREAREEKGLTLRDVAERTGFTKSQLARWESGKGLGSVGIIIDIAKVLDVEVEDLIRSRKRDHKREPLGSIRKRKDMSIKRLAEAVRLPPNLSHYIKRWQRGENIEKIRKLIRLAQFFNRNVTDLFDAADYTSRPKRADSRFIVLNQTEHPVPDLHQSTGIPLHTLRKWSGGEIHPTITDALILCEKLGYRLESLFNKGGKYFALQLRSICQDADITESELCHNLSGGVPR